MTTSRATIESLREGHAFDPSPQPSDLSLLHVPFDSLVDGARTEGALERAARAMERVALVGRSGVGKSSVISHVFRLGSPFAPIVLSVANERTEVATDPGEFASHAVQVLARYADETELTPKEDRERFLQAVAEERVLPSTEKGISAGLKLAPWIASLELQGDLKRVQPAAVLTPSATEYIHALDEIIEIVKTTDLLPVFVIDDSDRWLNVGDAEPRSAIVAPFMTRVLRMLMERSIGLVVAVHDAYTDLPEYEEARATGIIDTAIDIPPLPEQAALDAILNHRVRLHAQERDIGDAFSPSAREALWSVYANEADRRLRTVLQVAHGALAEADLATLDEPIGPELVRSSAVAALGD